MANGGMLYSNAALDATPTASTSASGYSITDAVDSRPATVHRSTGTSLTVTWDMGAAVSITGASVHNHNIATGSTVLVEFSSDNFAHTHATETMTAATGLDFFLTFAAARSYQYVRFNITISSGYVQVGEYCLWKSKWTFTRNPVSPETRLYQVLRYRSPGSQASVSNYGERYGFGMTWRALPTTEMPYFVAALKAGNVCYAPDLSDTDACYHGALSSDTLSFGAVGTLEETSAEFWANPVGV